MITQTISPFLSNIPVVMFITAIVVAALTRLIEFAPERYLSWLLLFSVGVEALWSGLFHVFFPELASAQIGWQPGPYEFEIGVADISLGVVAIAAFWRSLSFKSAIMVFSMMFDAGVLIGHFQQAFAANDFSPDNFGALQIVTALHIILLPILLHLTWRHRKQATPN